MEIVVFGEDLSRQGLAVVQLQDDGDDSGQDEGRTYKVKFMAIEDKHYARWAHQTFGESAAAAHFCARPVAQ